MKTLQLNEIEQVTGGASKKTIFKSGVRIVAKNLVRGLAMGTPVGAAVAVVWFTVDLYLTLSDN